MFAWNHRLCGWDLWLIVYAIVALSAATDICGFQRFAPTLGLPAWAGALCVIPVKLIEWRFLTFAQHLFQCGFLGKSVSAAPVLAWCLAVNMSMLAAHSTIYDMLTYADGISAKAVETRSNTTAAFKSVTARLELVSKPLPRPSKIVEQALGWEPQLPEPVHRATRDCTRFVGDALPDACRKRVELRKELAMAVEFERLSRRSEELRVELEGLVTGAGQNSMPRSFDIFLGRFVNVDGRDGIAFMGMAILTLVSAFGPFGLYMVGREGCAVLASAAISSVSGEPAQGIGQDCDQGARSDRGPPNSLLESALGEPAHAVRPMAQTAQTDRVSHLALPASVRGEPAHDPDQARPAIDLQIAQVQSALTRCDYRPPISDPAQSAVARKIKGAKRPARRRAYDEDALFAVRSFVGLLEKNAVARASGSALYQVYRERRPAHGWPELAPNVFGKLLKIAVEEIGGRKLKSGAQIYKGVRIPAEWCMKAAA
jgi:hypothetical protein